MTRAIAPLLVAVLLILTAPQIAAQADGAAETPPPSVRLRVGVRSDAKPFVYSETAHLAPTGSERIPSDTDGFLFQLCKRILDSAALEAGFQYDFVPISAGARLGAMGDTGTMHMLCDPFTMTRERAGQFHFTPVVFVSGGSFLHWERSGDGNDNDARAYRWGLERTEALLKSDTAILSSGGIAVSKLLDAPRDDGTRQRLRDDVIEGLEHQTEVIRCDDPAHRDGQIRSIRVGLVEGSTAAQIVNNALAVQSPLAINRAKHETVCYETFENHRSGIEELCKTDRVDRPPLTYYFGDRDIIVSNLDALQNPADDSVQPRCLRVRAARQFYSVEPYAFPISTRVPDHQILAIRKALLDFASTSVGNGRTQRTGMFALFQEHFSGKVPSEMLRAVFSLLVVPQK